MKTEKTHIALYPGSFDVLTYGHLDIIERASSLFDRLHVAVAINKGKTPLFTIEERLEMLCAETGHLGNVKASAFDGLTVDYAVKLGANYVIRGLRVVSDFEDELQMALMNRSLDSRVETLFMVPAAEHLFVSSSLIKEIVQLGGDIDRFVPPTTKRMLLHKYQIAKP